MKVDWSKPDFGKEELEAAKYSLNNYIGANGPEVEKLEAEFASLVGASYAVAVCNGTAALMVSLMCMKKKYGDLKVGVPSFTFIASANSSKQIFDDVVLLDCDPYTWNISNDNISDDIELLMSVDVGGLSCDYSKLKKLNIPIVADSAESAGSTCRGAIVGTQADMHCFSLHRAKVVSCGEGGIITTNSKELYEMAKSFVNHGYAKDKKPYEYKHDNFGLNFRMSDVNAAIARVQIKKLDFYVEHRNKIANIYKNELKNFCEFQQFDEEKFLSNYFFFGILIKERDEVIKHLLNKDIVAKTWTAAHQQPIWNTIHLPSSSYISDNIILLPIHNTIQEREVEYVVKTLKEIL